MGPWVHDPAIHSTPSPYQGEGRGEVPNDPATHTPTHSHTHTLTNATPPLPHPSTHPSPWATVEPLPLHGAGCHLILGHTGVQRISGTVHKGLRERWIEG